MSSDTFTGSAPGQALFCDNNTQEPDQIDIVDQPASSKYRKHVSRLHDSIDYLVDQQDLRDDERFAGYNIDFAIIIKQAEEQINEAVISTKNAQLERYYPNHVGRFAGVGRPPISPLQSDDSDVDECDANCFFKDLARRMRAFHEDKQRHFLVLKGLTSRQRRHVHAIAHFMQYGHVSVGEPPQRLLLISRDKTRVPAYFKSGLRRLRRDQNETNIVLQDKQELDQLETNIPYTSPLLRESNDMPDLYFEPQGSLENRYVDPYMGMNQCDGSFDDYSTASASSGGFSSAGSFGSRKRRRQSRHEGQFICLHDGCFEVFDRQCDLSHHERIHLPYEQRPHACGKCEKRFLFPKDLRRHERTHPSTQSHGSNFTAWDDHEVDCGVRFS